MRKVKFHWLGLFLALSSAQPLWADVQTCGTSGTLAERIEDCGNVFGAAARFAFPMNDPLEPNGTYDWRLVTRTPSRAQVWFDETSLRVWSDTANDEMKLDDGLKFCQDERSGSEIKGRDQLNLTGMDRLSFNIPTKGDIQAAIKHGAQQVLPNFIGGSFWTSTGWMAFDICSSTYVPGYYPEPFGPWVPGYQTFSCELFELMTTATIFNESVEWNGTGLMFDVTRKVRCVATAAEQN